MAIIIFVPKTVINACTQYEYLASLKTDKAKRTAKASTKQHTIIHWRRMKPTLSLFVAFCVLLGIVSSHPQNKGYGEVCGANLHVFYECLGFDFILNAGKPDGWNGSQDLLLDRRSPQMPRRDQP